MQSCNAMKASRESEAFKSRPKLARYSDGDDVDNDNEDDDKFKGSY